MKLTQGNIKGIELLLDQGHRVQLYVEKDKVLDAGYGEKITRSEQLTIEGLPPDEEVLHFPPVVVSMTEDIKVRLTAFAQDGTVDLGDVKVPAGTTLTGFLTGKYHTK